MRTTQGLPSNAPNVKYDPIRDCAGIICKNENFPDKIFDQSWICQASGYVPDYSPSKFVAPFGFRGFYRQQEKFGLVSTEVSSSWDSATDFYALSEKEETCA